MTPAEWVSSLNNTDSTNNPTTPCCIRMGEKAGDFGDGIRRDCTRKRLLILIFILFAIVILGLLAELRAKWAEARFEENIHHNGTAGGTTTELPFFNP